MMTSITRAARLQTRLGAGALLGASGFLATVLAVVSPAAAQSFPLECAQRDAQLVTQIERHGEAQDVPGEILFEAFWTVQRARDACADGRVTVGLALYDSIFKTSLAGLKELQ
jgi:hypothetical protein